MTCEDADVHNKEQYKQFHFQFIIPPSTLASQELVQGQESSWQSPLRFYELVNCGAGGVQRPVHN